MNLHYFGENIDERFEIERTCSRIIKNYKDPFLLPFTSNPSGQLDILGHNDYTAEVLL